MTAPADTPRKPRPRTRRIVAVPLALLILWLGGLVWYAEDMPRAVGDGATTTDAVIVLTGGSGRLEVGFQLLADGRAQKLLISGVAREVNAEELIRLYGHGRAAELRCCVVIGHNAGDTAGNARETAQWMAEQGFSSLRLVTASYHMRRSLLEFRHAMPQITIIPHAVFPEGFRGGDWWRWPGTLNLLISEYTKFLGATARHAVGVGDAQPPTKVPGGQQPIAPVRSSDTDRQPAAPAPADSLHAL